MKTFKEFVSEAMAVRPAFNLPRSQMPQIDDVQHFSNFIDAGTWTLVELVNDLRPTQQEFDKWKVNNIKMEWRKNPELRLEKPIIASVDGFVVDGHHRYFAALQSGNRIPITYVDLNVTDLLIAAKEYLEALGSDSKRVS